eukprot:scaffold12129_cov57-Phaeocystis_antarctica.AAC.2
MPRVCVLLAVECVRFAVAESLPGTAIAAAIGSSNLPVGSTYAALVARDAGHARSIGFRGQYVVRTNHSCRTPERGRDEQEHGCPHVSMPLLAASGVGVVTALLSPQEKLPYLDRVGREKANRETSY